MNDHATPPATPLQEGLLRSPFFQAALIVLLGMAAYAHTFHFPFQLDDYRRMLDAPYVRDLGYLTDWQAAHGYAADHAFRVRFLGYLSFALNYAVGGSDVVGYHAVNLAIHLANALLVYLLVRVTFGTPFFAECGMHDPKPETRNFIPLLAALLFVVHPVQTEAVTYVVQRLASLATLFCLASLLLYVKARQALREEGWGWKGGLRYGGSLCCALLAMKTKEIAFTFPLAVALYDFMFLRDRPARRFACLVPLLLTMLVIPLSILAAPGTGGYTAGHADELTRVASALSRSDYLFTELRVIVTYVRLLFLPVNQNLAYDYPVFHSLFAPQVILSGLFLLALLGLAVYLTYRSTSDAGSSTSGIHDSKFIIHNSPLYRLIAFGMFWFFLTLSVESSIIPIADVIFEHRLYLPSVGAFIALATAYGLLGERLADRVRGGGRMAVALACLVVLALTVAAYARNEVWKSQESLWRDVVRKSPGKSFGFQGLGIALAEKGDIPGAFASFDRALALDPEAAEIYCNRGTLYAQAGSYGKAIADFDRAAGIDPSLPEAWNNLGLAWSETGDQERAARYLARAVDLDPDNAQAHNNLGLALARSGRPAAAIERYDRAIALNRNYARAYFNRGSAYRESGRRDRAGADFRTACELGDERGCRELSSLPGR